MIISDLDGLCLEKSNQGYYRWKKHCDFIKIRIVKGVMSLDDFAVCMQDLTAKCVLNSLSGKKLNILTARIELDKGYFICKIFVTNPVISNEPMSAYLGIEYFNELHDKKFTEVFTSRLVDDYCFNSVIPRDIVYDIVRTNDYRYCLERYFDKAFLGYLLSGRGHFVKSKHFEVYIS